MTQFVNRHSIPPQLESRRLRCCLRHEPRGTAPVPPVSPARVARERGASVVTHIPERCASVDRRSRRPSRRRAMLPRRPRRAAALVAWIAPGRHAGTPRAAARGSPVREPARALPLARGAGGPRGEGRSPWGGVVRREDGGALFPLIESHYIAFTVFVMQYEPLPVTDPPIR